MPIRPRTGPHPFRKPMVVIGWERPASSPPGVTLPTSENRVSDADAPAQPGLKGKAESD